MSAVLTALLALQGLLAAAGARSLLVDPSQLASSLAGRALVVEIDWQRGRRPERLLAVQTPDGRRVQVEVDAGNQAAWQASRSLITGQAVSMRGAWSPGRAPAAAAASTAGPAPGTHFIATTIQIAEPRPAVPGATGGTVRPAAAAAAASGSLAVASLGPHPSSNTPITNSLAALIVPLVARDARGAYCAGTGAPPLSVDQIKDMVFEERSPGEVTVGSTYNRCSGGQLTLTQSNSQVVEPVVLPCNGTAPVGNTHWNVSSCPLGHFMAFADEADRVMAQERKIDLSAHPFRVYLTPPGSCDFTGVAFLGCDYTLGCRAWIGGDSWHERQAIVHELGHSLFMHHAGSFREDDDNLYDEYADDSCAMGYCCNHRCPNTPHMWQMGWLEAAEYDHTNLGVGQTVTLALAAQGRFGDERHRAVRVVPSWVPPSASTSSSQAVDPLFIGYRTGLGVDAELYDSIRDHVLLYTSPVASARDPRFTTLRAALKDNAAWSYAAADLVVRTKALGSDAAQISICRQAPNRRETAASCANRLDFNCDGRVSQADPQCLAFLQPLVLKPPRRVARRPSRTTSLRRRVQPGH